MKTVMADSPDAIETFTGIIRVKISKGLSDRRVQAVCMVLVLLTLALYTRSRGNKQANKKQ